MPNQFSQIATDLQGVPQNQRPDALITAIAQTLQQNGNQQAQQMAQDLQTAKPQLVKACQQTG